ncbi:MAG TPA: prepilin-type N-terminal cleavage/methylation domain-containing protein [Sumerlaeia bacterium]|nr:prepilin-type N-terminal cleavage/methylation domain-containing protein [Sumerlaeia bacterium]
MFRPRSAFTLIELLIVVAIIAILAAIAVPNFLEAQTRSKVARTKADIRSLRTAMEAYAVDCGKYPPDHSYHEPATWSQLTTPVAYITSILRNPYEARNIAYPSGWLSVFGYSAELIVDGGGGVQAWPSELSAMGLRYWLNSAGPDEWGDHEAYGWNSVALWRGIDSGTGYVDVIYNPTNGTRSSGDLLASNKRFYD